MEREGSLPSSQQPATWPYSEPDQSTPSQPICLRSILILSFHLRLGLASGLVTSAFPTTTLCQLSSPPTCATCLAELILLHFITRVMFGEEYRSRISSLCNFLQSLPDNTYTGKQFRMTPTQACGPDGVRNCDPSVGAILGKGKVHLRTSHEGPEGE